MSEPPLVISDIEANGRIAAVNQAGCGPWSPASHPPILCKEAPGLYLELEFRIAVAKTQIGTFRASQQEFLAELAAAVHAKPTAFRIKSIGSTAVAGVNSGRRSRTAVVDIILEVDSPWWTTSPMSVYGNNPYLPRVSSLVRCTPHRGT
jgi:hypothetical protein